MSPWVAFALVTLGLVGAVAVSYWQIGGAAAGIAIAAATIGLGALQTRDHVEANREVRALRASMRPPSLLRRAWNDEATPTPRNPPRP